VEFCFQALFLNIWSLLIFVAHLYSLKGKVALRYDHVLCECLVSVTTFEFFIQLNDALFQVSVAL